ncbi:hypothetical protein HYT23_00575 [Candidatus Pacearchaeota archaeon]|nr:hypothetical protein [Candidatus Pacearchaeota archaeon]
MSRYKVSGRILAAVAVYAKPLVDFYNMRFNRNLDFQKFSRSDLVYEAGKIHAAEGTEFNADELIEEVEKFFLSKDFSNLPPFEDAVRVVKRLAVIYNLTIITARHSAIHEHTKAWLAKHFPDTFQTINFAHFGKWGYPHKISKVEKMRENGVSILIDDALYNILPAAGAGIKALLYGDYPWNKEIIALPKNVKRAKDWKAVERILCDKKEPEMH